MTHLPLSIRFIEPFRVMEWHNPEHRENSIRFQRGLSFARWHKRKKDCLGWPYITGTLVRSALIQAAELRLWLNQGRLEWEENGQTQTVFCCPGAFEGNGGKRRRQTLTWENKSECCAENPCPFCLLIGRYENIKHDQVCFCNFNVTEDGSDPAPVLLEEVSGHRIINRVDQLTGKAEDFFGIREISPDVYDTFYGEIRLSGKTENNGGLMHLIHQALPMVDTIAGGLCHLEVNSILREDRESPPFVKGDSGGFSDGIKNPPCPPLQKGGKVEKSSSCYGAEPCNERCESGEMTPRLNLTPGPFLSEKGRNPSSFTPPFLSGKGGRGVRSDENAISACVKQLAAAFENEGKQGHLRVFSDAVRELRRRSPENLRFPAGHRDRTGKNADHFLWDMPVEKERKLRDRLPEILKQIAKEHGITWEKCCEDAGKGLYEAAKQIAAHQFPAQRPLGTAQGIRIADSTCPVIRTRDNGPEFEHLIEGNLHALTPFFFGWEDREIWNTQTGEQSEQTSLRLLRDRNGRMRLARSALRGILRRDLREVCQTGCRAELALKTPCSCPVCVIMGKVKIQDSVSNYDKPPRIRHRIRLDHKSGTVDQGALFDMEVGPRGLHFPFRIWVRTCKEELPAQLCTVLCWWSKGLAFLSGESGTGKGRFQLENLKIRTWNLCEDFADYSRTCGGRKSGPEDSEYLPLSASSSHPWEKFEDVELSVTTPFLTKDPVESLLFCPEITEENARENREGTDAICYTASVADSSGKETGKEYLLKSESFRGLLRTAVGRCMTDQNIPVPLLHKHEDCRCLLCRIFGNEHEAGKIRVEDLTVQGEIKTKKIDRVAIDRFTGGAKDKHKFDLLSLCANPDNPLRFCGTIWTRKDLDAEEKAALRGALQEIQAGKYSLGGLDNAGYGWLNYPQKTEAKGQKPAAMRLMREFEFRLFKETYWPHYFLPLGSKVMRKHSPPGHGVYDGKLHSGRLVCSLQVKTPLIIPDTETVKREKNGHQIFDFFSLNGKPCIPGSEIRGMVSSVFEALSSSCLRVFDEKKRLSWRMKAEKLEQWKPGRIYEENGSLMLEEMQEIRLPVYDNPELVQKIREKAREGFYRDKQPTKSDCIINANAESIRRLLKNKPMLISGQIPAGYFKCAPHGMDNIAVPEVPPKLCNRNKSGWVSQGSIHFTGPNKVEMKKIKGTDTAAGQSISNDPLQIVHNTVEADDRTVKNKYGQMVERKRAVPKFKTVSDGIEYDMSKRCERVFVPIRNANKYPVSAKTDDKFRQLCSEYVKNGEKIPEVFRTILPENGRLSKGDLIYFREENGAVAEIIPVKISRTVDDELMTQKLPEDFRPCVHEITNPEQEKQMKKAGIKDLYLHHPDGLCPACSLFGTPFYKGRVAFGFAFAKENPPRLCKNGKHITLPLLERPRPTWSMPDKANRVPGRKFYVHHQGWKDVTENPDQQKPEENNRSVQAVESGEFCFEVRFENLEKWELGLLIYSLQLEDGLAHKLGMGKALGFGSTEITVEAVYTDEENLNPRKVAEDARQKLGEIWKAEDDKKLAEKLDSFFRLMVYIENDGVKVRYPALRKEDDLKEKKQGYMELAKEADYDMRNRQKKLTKPWTAWG